MPSPVAQTPVSSALEVRIVRSGDDLLRSLTALMDTIPGKPQCPQALADTLGIDKVLASRMLKAVRAADPIAALHRMPGPEPLRRVVNAAGNLGAPAELIASASAAVADFEQLIRQEFGDRGSLDAIVSGWIPQARREFEIRRKQSAFRAMSQLRCVEADALMATVFLHPSSDGENLDVVWLIGLKGVRRLRPGAVVKLASRKIDPSNPARKPCTLEGRHVEDYAGLLLSEFCSSPTPALNIHRTDTVVHYSLAGDAFGPGSAVDLSYAEVNRAEINRYARPGPTRRAYVFAEASVPASVLQFDAIVHEDVYPGDPPGVRFYDTSFEGIASVNDRSRDIDRLDVHETVENMGTGLARFRSADIPRYSEMLARVCRELRWDERRLRGYRCRVEFPVYGSQVTMDFAIPHRS
jgi:hypothetical protein